MINKNIIFAGLTRDCENSLKTNIPLIEKLRKQFVWSEVVIVENDSIDRTKCLLAEWKTNSKGVTIISNDFGTKTIPDRKDVEVDPWTSYWRIEKMTRYRNLYLEHISQIDHPIDIVIIIDIDIIDISIDGLMNAIHHFNDKIGAIFSNGVSVKQTPFGLSSVYFDIFALWEYPFVGEFSHSPESQAKTFKSINKNLKKTSLYPVISAFGGVGIYNYQAIKDLRYKTTSNPLNHLEAICEHITFNQEIIKLGFHNYISRDFKVIYPSHGWTVLLKLFLPFKIFNFLYPIILKAKIRLKYRI